MKGRINIVRPRLGRAGHEPTIVQGAEQGQGKGRFARITARAAYDKAGYARLRLGHVYAPYDVGRDCLAADAVSVAAGPRQ